MDKYDILEKIGEGSYGTVFKAKVKATGQVVALKKTSPQTTAEGFPASTLREIANLKLLARGENIVKLLAVEIAKNAKGQRVLYMVFEFMHCDLMDLYSKYSINHESMSPVVIKNLMFQLLRGVEYCHKHGVIHRDLKPQNLLVDLSAGLLKVADLGLGRVQRKKFKWYTDEVATLWYRPPELLLGDTNYSFALDIWSIGCIFAELCNLKPLFDGDSELSQIIIIFQTLGTPNEEVWPGISRLKHWNPLFPKFKPKDLGHEVPSLDECGLDLLSKMLQYDPSKRIPARNALSHPYFFELQGSVLGEARLNLQ